MRVLVLRSKSSLKTLILKQAEDARREIRLSWQRAILAGAVGAVLMIGDMGGFFPELSAGNGQAFWGIMAVICLFTMWFQRQKLLHHRHQAGQAWVDQYGYPGRDGYFGGLGIIAHDYFKSVIYSRRWQSSVSGCISDYPGVFCNLGHALETRGQAGDLRSHRRIGATGTQVSQRSDR